MKQKNYWVVVEEDSSDPTYVYKTLYSSLEKAKEKVLELINEYFGNCHEDEMTEEYIRDAHETLNYENPFAMCDGCHIYSIHEVEISE